MQENKELVVDFRRRRHSLPIPVNIQVRDIESVTSYKYLYVHLNNKLDWTDHARADYIKLPFILLLWLSAKAVAFSLPLLPLTFPAWLLCLVLSILVRLSPHRSTNWNYGFDQLVSQRNWHHLLDEKLGFGGTWLSCRDVCSWLHEGLMGDVACRVPSCTLRGGCWRHLPIRNRDYRLPADWIRRCSGLSENKGNSDSCQKPLKAAHDDWCAGQSCGRCWHSERGS